MGAIRSNTTLEAIADRLKEARRVVITTHAKPDGDAFGGTVALARMLDRLGKEARVWHTPPVPESFSPILNGTRIHVVDEESRPDDDVDLIVIVDTCARSQLESLAGYLERNRERVCVIDHHIQGDDVGEHVYVDSSAGSVCEILVELVPLLGVPLEADVATPLYLGIATDTGWFRFSNTSAKTMRYAARLLETGVDHNFLMQLSEQRDRPSRLQLLARALSSMEFLNHYRAVVLTLRREDFQAVDAQPDDTHGLADFPLCVESVQLVCVIAESEPGVVKLSLRSKAGANAIDVNGFAGRFGGGGHARASGAKITNRSLDAVRREVVEAINEL